MIVFSGVASQREERGALPAGANFETADTLVPAGTLIPPKRNSESVSWSCVGLSPLELGVIGPDAMEDDSELTSSGNPSLLGPYTFDELGSPSLQWRRMPDDGRWNALMSPLFVPLRPDFIEGLGSTSHHNTKIFSGLAPIDMDP
jgi:hypothetical protein